MKQSEQDYTISIYTENNIGLLSRISGIFSRRHINIESINSSVCEIPDVSRWTIVVSLSEDRVRRIIGQIEKQVEVIKAFYHLEEETFYQESCLFKMKSDGLLDDEKLQAVVTKSQARIIAITKGFYVIEKSGSKSEVEALYGQLQPHGIMQFVRAGRIAVTKNEMNISTILKSA